MRRPWLVPLLVFAAVLVQGAAIGLTDDEAYYWVLAQKPALGYAYHPPAIALSIAGAQAVLGWLFGHASEGLVRLPAAACAAIIVALGQAWIARASADARGAAPDSRGLARGGIALVAFAGIFGLSWMMVPDLPLLAGWTLAFLATWELCFGRRFSRAWGLALAGGMGLAILSKYSAVLGGASSLAAIWLWAPRERRLRATAALALGGLIALVPILWWNSQHGWASILYQVRERHGGAGISWLRYSRFWAVEFVLMGPALFAFFFSLLLRGARGLASRPERFALVWILPAALVFCLQPLWADFKPHWALIVWWPAALALALRAARAELPSWQRAAHLTYGFALITLVWASCHLPLLSWATSRFGVSPMDPRLDVTNDLFGWSDLSTVVPEGMPVVASRYQTASQAAFAMAKATGFRNVTLLPRDLKAMDEWPDIGVSEGQGPDWPKLTAPVLFVADNRYEAGPEYPGARCVPAGRIEKTRFGFAAKTILTWKCEPSADRSH